MSYPKDVRRPRRVEPVTTLSPVREQPRWSMERSPSRTRRTPSPTSVVETAPVWKSGMGNAVVDTFLQGPMPRNQPVSKQFWVTRDVALAATWSVRLDTGNDVSESDNNDNTCTSWYNPN
jgi:hypothetical protein